MDKDIEQEDQRNKDHTINMAHKMSVPALIDADDFQKLTSTDRMGTVLSKINLICAKLQINDKLMSDDDIGFETRITTVQTQLDTNSKTIAELKWENNVLKGLVQRQAKQMKSLSDKVSLLTVKSMIVRESDSERNHRRYD